MLLGSAVIEFMPTLPAQAVRSLSADATRAGTEAGSALGDSLNKQAATSGKATIATLSQVGSQAGKAMGEGAATAITPGLKRIDNEFAQAGTNAGKSLTANLAKEVSGSSKIVSELGATGTAAGKAMGDGAANGVGSSLKSLIDKFKQVGQQAGEAGGEAAGNSFADKLTAGKAAMLGGAAALGLGFSSAITGAISATGANDKLKSQLGLTTEESGRLGKAAGSLYSKNYGASLDEVNEAIASVVRDIPNMRTASIPVLKDISAGAMDISRVFGQDVGGTTKAVASLMRTGLAPDAKSALDLITTGLQKVPKAGEDLLDTFNEYGVQFQKLGIDGPHALGLIKQMMDAGARDTDIAADAIKEFSLRTMGELETMGKKGKPMLTALGAAFQAVIPEGTDMYDVQNDLAAGGERSAKAFAMMTEGMKNITDPTLKAQMATELFGTQSEDLGAALFAMDFDTAVTGLGKIEGANKGIIANNPQATIDGFTRALQAGFVDILGNKVLPVVISFGKHIVEHKKLYLTLAAILGGVALAYGAVTAAMAVQAAGGMVAFIKNIVTSTKLWTAGQWLLNAAMSANPIGIVVVAVTALIAIIVVAYKKNEAFRDLVNKVWAAIKTAIAGVADWFTKTAWPAMQTAIKALGDFFTWLWKNALVPAWNGIRTAVEVVWAAIKAIFTAITTAVKALATLFGWLRDQIVAIWNGIKSAILTVWTFIKVSIFDAMMAFIRGPVTSMWNAFKATLATLWTAIKVLIDTSWKAIKVILDTMMNFVKGPVTLMWTTFKNTLNTLWTAIKTLINLAWLGVQVILNAMITFVKGPLTTMWNNFKTFISTLWTAIKTFINNAWLGIKIIFEAIGTYVRGIFTNMWNAFKLFITTLWTTIKTMISTTWSGIKAIFEAIGSYVRGTFMTMWNNFKAGLTLVWDGIKSMISQAWTWVKTQVFEPMSGYIRGALVTAWNTAKTGIINAWNAIKAPINAAWSWLKTTVFTPLSNLITSTIPSAFQRGVSGITAAWDKVKAAAATPVKFVIDKIINGGIIKGFNWISDKVGGPHIDNVSYAFASGGVLPGYTPGKDVHRFVSPTGGTLDLSGGEAIMRPEFTKAVGSEFVHAGNAAARGGGTSGVRKFLSGFMAHGDHAQFKDGGILGDIVGGVKKAWDTFTDPGAVLKKAVSGLLGGIPGGGYAKDMLSATVNKVMDSVVSWITNKASVGSIGSMGSAGGPGNWSAMWNWVKSRFPGTDLYSGYRNSTTLSGNKSLHASGRAIDITPNHDISRAIISTFGSKITELISPWPAEHIWHGKPHNYGNAIDAQHGVYGNNAHIHWAMRNGGILGDAFKYDDGGWFKPGQVGVNQLGKPEAVLTPAESQGLKAMGTDKLVDLLEELIEEVRANGHTVGGYIRGSGRSLGLKARSV